MEAENPQIITDESDPLEGSDSDVCSLDSQCIVEEKQENNEELEKLSLEKICESIDEEERLLNDLENRRKKLEADMERLEKEIENEKQFFREAIDEEIAKKKEFLSIGDNSSVGADRPKPEFFNLGEFHSKFQEIREVIQESAEQSPNKCEDDEELERFKSNLASYKKTIDETKKDSINKQKKRTATKLFQKHLEEVEIKCDEQMDKLANIQKSIEVGNLFEGYSFLDGQRKSFSKYS